MEYRTKSTRGNQWNAESVRALRAHLGLTQQQLSGELGTRQQTISEWERGLYRPRGASRTILNLIAERAGFEYGTTPPAGVGSPMQTEERSVDETKKGQANSAHPELLEGSA